jgi:hypothetical protein
MEQKEIQINIVEEEKIIQISNINPDTINISYLEDIDYTPLVQSLVENIDTAQVIIYEKIGVDAENLKLNLVTDTIYKILESYNKNIKIHDSEFTDLDF